jgi:iron complex outermembrane receptor protein
VFGQNAFTGAVNIVTKDLLDIMMLLMASLVLLLPRELVCESNHILHQKNISNGYRYNTDFDNQNFVLSVLIKINQ